jgi:hypothetical protein
MSNDSNDNESSGCLGSFMVWLGIFVLLPILYVFIFVEPLNFSTQQKNTSGGQSTQNQSFQYYCNTCGKQTGGHVLREREYDSETGKSFLIETIVLDCGHRQVGR